MRATTTDERRARPANGPVPFPRVSRPGQHRAEAIRAGAVEAEWRWLYRIGGVAAVLLVVLTVLHAGVFFVAGLPTTVAEWFALFQESALLGLLAFELLMVVYVVVSVPVVLALYAALRRASPSLMAAYLALSLIGIGAFVAARPGFEMLSLSQSHAAAATDAERSVALAAGEAMLATFHGTAFWVSYVLGSVGGLLSRRPCCGAGCSAGPPPTCASPRARSTSASSCRPSGSSSRSGPCSACSCSTSSSLGGSSTWVEHQAGWRRREVSVARTTTGEDGRSWV